MNLCIRILVLFVLFRIAQSKDLPEYLRNLKCNIYKDFEECFKKNGNLAIPLVSRGDPEYHIPKLNPMEISFMQLVSTPSLSLNSTNLKVHGLDKLKILNNSFKFDEGLFSITLKGNNLTLNGEYNIDGQVMLMPMKGNGEFSIFLKNGIFTAINVNIQMEKDGEKYFKPDKVSLEYHFEKIEFQFRDLFEGNKKLGEQVNRFLNENWRLLVADFGPGIADTITNIIERIYTEFASEIPIKNFFL